MPEHSNSRLFYGPYMAARKDTRQKGQGMAGEGAETTPETRTDTQVTPALMPPEDQMDDELEHPVLTGHPALGETEEEEESGPGKGEGGELGEEKPPEEKPEEKPGEGGEPPKQLKYKSHEEAERAYEEAERKMHEATTRASQEAEARENLQRELDDLKAKAAEKEEKPPEPPVSPEERKTKLLAVAKTANRKALDKISELDRTDPDYTERVAEAWAEANAEALLEAGFSTSTMSEEEISKIVKKQVEAEREAEEARRAEQRQKDEAEASARVWDKAVSLAEKAGLDMGDEDSADYILFDRFARKVPEEVRKEPLEKQVKWVVGQVRARVGQAVQTDKQREEAARKHQNDNAVLGRGSHTPRTTQKEKPGSLDDDFEAARQKRTL